MKSMWIEIAYNAIRVFVGPGRFDMLAEVVRQNIPKNIEGAIKKQAVIDLIVAQGWRLSFIIADLLIAAVRAKFEERPKVIGE